MAPKFDFCSTIASATHNLRFLARVVRKWLVLDPEHPGEYFTLEFVLMDSQGDRIGCTVRNQLVYKFQDKMQEDDVYLLTKINSVVNGGEYRSTSHKFKLSFDINTVVAKQNSANFPLITYSFTPPADVFAVTYDCNYFVDVIGFLTGVSKEREFIKKGVKSKLMVIELDNQGFKFKFTLFGDDVDALNRFIASGEAINSIVVIMFAKVKKWQGNNTICSNFSTKILLNPDIPEAHNLRATMVVNLDTPVKGLSQLQEKTTTKISLADDFLDLTPRATIKQMKDAYLKDKGICPIEDTNFVIYASICGLVDESFWYYTACIRCMRKATPDSGMYYCGKCKRHVIDVSPKFLLRLQVKDDTAGATFVMFDRDAADFLNISCVELLQSHIMNGDADVLPNQLADLKDQSFLFKVGCDRGSGSKFEPSYLVKRVTSKSELIQKYLEGCTVDAAHHYELDTSPVEQIANGKVTDDVAQDLMGKFDEDHNQTTNGELTGVVDLCDEGGDRDVIMKRSRPIGEEASMLETVTKNIKIEKD